MAASIDTAVNLRSRRDLFRWLASLFAAVLVKGVRAQSIVRTGLSTQLAREFPHSTEKALSPDGQKLCLEDWKAAGYPFRIIEVGTWQVLYVGRLRARLGPTHFFTDNDTLLSETPGGMGENRYWQTILDVITGEKSERPMPRDPFTTSERVFPMQKGSVLVVHTDRKPRYETTSLSLVAYDNYRELKKVPYATRPREPRLRQGTNELVGEWDLRVSDDRTVIAYSLDNTLVCRRTEDLAVLSTSTIETDVRATKLSLSSDGTYLAAACVDVDFILSIEPTKKARKYYVAIYACKNGNEVARMQTNGADGIALSPNGELLAVVVRERERNADVPTVHIYEVSSGRKLASVIHDRVRGNNTFLTGSCTAAFTSDGRYLVTSGMTTKIWRLDKSTP